MTEDSIAVKPFAINKNTQKSIHCASDKSLTHRSIMFSSLAKEKALSKNHFLELIVYPPLIASKNGRGHKN